MPIRVTAFETTPNPNALKCLLDRRVSEGRRSFTGADASRADDPVAAAMLAIEGVTGVMLMDDWLTVLKEPDATWRPIRARVRRALEAIE